MKYVRKHYIRAAQLKVQYWTDISIPDKVSVVSATDEDGEPGRTVTAEVFIPERDMEMWMDGEEFS